MNIKQLIILLLIFPILALGQDINYPQQFLDVMKIVLKFEGGYTDLLDDPGGATNYGITQATYNAYRLSKHQSKKPVKQITKLEVYDCYYNRYYLRAKCDKLKINTSFVMFDSAVNFGVFGATKLLQRSLGVKVDGNFGKETILAVEEINDKKLALEFCDVRILRRYEIVRNKPSSKRFLRGWLNRDKKLKKIINSQ